MRTTITFIAVASLVLSSAAAFAQNRPDPGTGPAHATGQPGAECGEDDALGSPGHASNAPGSAFNENGKAGTVYAGEQVQNSRNSASVSQYDVACERVP